MLNSAEAEAILKQIIVSLAIAEECFLFEHRDLHLGNILVHNTEEESLPYVFRGKPFLLESNGVVVSIIDFTFSRIVDDGKNLLLY